MTVSRFRCPGCGYIYDEAVGDAREGFPAGTSWNRIPDDWACPDCAVREKPDFEPAGVLPVPADPVRSAPGVGHPRR